MKRALLSDIHGNLEALTAVLDDVRAQGAGEIFCLGDIVGYGPNPCECVDAVMQFQKKYADDILKPWYVKGLAKDMNPSGYAYKMTIYKINLLQCASLNTPAPQLP